MIKTTKTKIKKQPTLETVIESGPVKMRVKKEVVIEEKAPVVKVKKEKAPRTDEEILLAKERMKKVRSMKKPKALA